MSYLVNLTAFWLLDIRGVLTAWTICASLLTGLVVPVAFFPEPLRTIVWCTPFPWMFQVPLDVVLERGEPAGPGLADRGPLGGSSVLLALGQLVQRRAVRMLVVQGG